MSLPNKQGLKIVITAGPTRAWIDPVRYIQNASSGELGYYIAKEALKTGASITYVHGPVKLIPRAPGIELKPVESPNEVIDILSDLSIRHKHSPFDLWIHSMAILDYIPMIESSKKLDSNQNEVLIQLKQTPKIIDSIKIFLPGVQLVGFKLETGNDISCLKSEAIKLAERAHCDWVLANFCPFRDPNDHSAYIYQGSDQKWFGPIHKKKKIATYLIDLLIMSGIGYRHG